MARHARGLICVALTEERCDELELPPMVEHNTSPHQTAFCVSVEARHGTTTGHLGGRPRRHRARPDRPGDPARRTCCGPATCSRCAPAPAACCKRAGHTEASVDLARIAGLSPAAVICEIMDEDGSMARLPRLRAARPGARPRAPHGARPDRLPDAAPSGWWSAIAAPLLPTRYGDVPLPTPTAATLTGEEHVALVMGELDPEAAGAGAGPLPVPHRRRLRLGALRLRRAARDRAGADRRGGPRRAPLPAPGGARHRPGQQAARLRAAGRGRRHGRGQPAPRLPAGPARLRHRRADPARPRGPPDAADDQQPGQVRRPRAATAWRSSSACRSRCRPPSTPAATSRPRRTRWATS